MFWLLILAGIVVSVATHTPFWGAMLAITLLLAGYLLVCVTINKVRGG